MKYHLQFASTLQADDDANGPRGVFTTISEKSRPGAFVALITVSDSDTTGNGPINCTLEQTGNDVIASFELVSRPLQQTGEARYQLVTSSGLDREVVDSYNISVVCSDNGLPVAMTTKTYIRVEVLDENDNSPLFELAVCELR